MESRSSSLRLVQVTSVAAPATAINWTLASDAVWPRKPGTRKPENGETGDGRDVSCTSGETGGVNRENRGQTGRSPVSPETLRSFSALFIYHGLGQSACFRRGSQNDVCSSERNASISDAWLLRRALRFLVEQLPSRSHMIFGRVSTKEASLPEVSVLVTIATLPRGVIPSVASGSFAESNVRREQIPEQVGPRWHNKRHVLVERSLTQEY